MSNLYATNAELKARFQDDAEVAFLTDTGASGTPDETVLTEVIDHAEAVINSYAARQYKIPLAVSSDTGFAAMMRSVTLDIAQYFLVGRGNAITTAKQQLYDQAIDWLDKVAAGKVALPSPDTEATTASMDPLATYGFIDDTITSRAFGRDNVAQL